MPPIEPLPRLSPRKALYAGTGERRTEPLEEGDLKKRQAGKWLLLGALGVAIAGCSQGNGGGDPPGAGQGPFVGGAPEGDTGTGGDGEVIAGRVSDEIPPIASGALRVRTQTLAAGMTAPLFGTALPEFADRLFVVDQVGILWRVNLADGSKERFVDLSSLLVPVGIEALQGYDERERPAQQPGPIHSPRPLLLRFHLRLRLRRWARFLWLRPCPRLGEPRRLAALVEKAGTGDSWGVGGGLGECQARPPDPRLTPALRDLAALPVADKAEVCLRLCNLLGHVGDPRALGPLRALHAGLLPGSRLERRLGDVLGRIAGQPVLALEAESATLCDALEEAIARRAETLARSGAIREALHARILEHPDDDSARLVLADHHPLYLPRLIRAAARLGITRALRVHVQCHLHGSARRLLEEAASAFTRVEWNLPPDQRGL